MFHAIVNYDLAFIENGEVPMIPVIDWHYQNMAFVKSLFLKNSLNLGFCFAKGVGGEIAVEDSIGGDVLPDEPFLHHFDVDVDHVIIEPLFEIEASQRFEGQFLNTIKTRRLYLKVAFVPSPPVLTDLPVVF